MRTGIGYDSHRMVDGRKLILGGVEIQYQKGLLGHSDADVLIHAVIDAMFGAASMGDIGDHYPDSDERYKDISSMILLKDAYRLIKENGYKVVNIDSVILCESPRLRDYIPAMRHNIAGILEIPDNAVSIKAKTNEGMGDIGRGDMVAAMATILLASDNKKFPLY
ncbi:2-C-methyl-D-erythritol 2,4-cyclodiphosphate synthase [Calorimonas adulescens]|uniref:2-C-methyl-D-erythritol 2,4-cyclodiphosphate synthase n=1 Tax=Calorimonas adulescens TaxID=2606906 RepID=A0A5D8QGP2_9THEO|nr:2-C-methyl-D-erythritol 2,4-cyclodiphosphate synthase [Calorimonas adulescens]TZE82693.1 2-C-methyl-D-erythritol 2,4-cyclodiphosphate synthase [Calorimonas adulescens]